MRRTQVETGDRFDSWTHRGEVRQPPVGLARAPASNAAAEPYPSFNRRAHRATDTYRAQPRVSAARSWQATGNVHEAYAANPHRRRMWGSP